MLLSIHPTHVEKILAGSKTTELRRTRPGVLPGQPVAIYSTAPTGAVVATCRVERVERSSLPRLRRNALGSSCVSSQEFTRYFDGCDSGTAIHICDVQALAVPVALSHLRANSKYSPPQTWHFIDEPKLAAMLGNHPSRRHFDSMFCV